MPLYTDQTGRLVEARQCRPELRMDIQDWCGVSDKAMAVASDEDWIATDHEFGFILYQSEAFDGIFTPVQ